MTALAKAGSKNQVLDWGNKGKRYRNETENKEEAGRLHFWEQHAEHRAKKNNYYMLQHDL